MSCREQVEIKDMKEVMAKNNLKRAAGVCPKCGTNVSRILGKG